jgi:hypothetical protein
MSRAKTTKEPPKVAIESLTSAEAVWHMAVLITFLALYIVAVVMVRFSLAARILTLLAVIGAIGLAAAVLAAIAKTHRSSVLQSLRSAMASGDANRIRMAIWRAQAAGLSAEDVAATQELRAALSGKLQSALADRDVEKLSSIVRCAQTAELAGDVMGAAVEMLQEDIGNGQKKRGIVMLPAGEHPVNRPIKLEDGQIGSSVLVAVPTAPSRTVQAAQFSQRMRSTAGATTAQVSCRGTRGGDATSRSEREVGMTAEEVAFAERVLCCPGQESEPCQANRLEIPYHQRPVCSTPVPVSRQEQSTANSRERGAATIPAAPSTIEEALTELHRAVEAGEAEQMRAAISGARAAGVSAEEVTLAEAVLQIEETRLRRTALHALQQAMHNLRVIGANSPAVATIPASTDVEKLRVAVRRAQAAGVGAEYLQEAKALLLAAESRLRARWAHPALRQSGNRHRGKCSNFVKKVTFADENFRIKEV